ncbi:MAG: PAS domain S-box protein [Promethearchaeota archaeon]
MKLEQNKEERKNQVWEASKDYQLLIKHAPLGIFLADNEGNINLVNSSLVEMLGSPSAEATKQINLLTFPLLQAAGISNAIKHCIENGESSVNEFFYKSKWGKEIFCRLYLNPAIDNSGEIIGVQGIVEDITKWKYLNDKLKESEENYKNLVENAHEGVWAVDENDNTIFVNPKLCEMLGYTKDEMMGTNLHLHLEKSMSELVNSYRERRTDGLKDTYELEFIKKDRTILKTRINAAPIFSEKGEFRGSFAYITDITKRKIAEQKLKESESKFRRIFESIPDLFFLVDGDTTILDFKGKEENLYLPPEQFLGKKLADIMPSEVGSLSLNSVKNTINTQQPQLMEYSLIIGNKTRDFEARYLYFSGDRVAIFVREITERKKAIHIIEQEVEKLKELDQIRKDLIIRISHELKTPLVSICGGTELLLKLFKEKFEKEELDLLEVIEKGGKRLKHLIDNLLDITKIEFKKLELKRESIDLVKLIRDCVKEMMYLIKSRDLELQLFLPEELILKIDKIRIEQVILNLLSNAIKNTAPYGKINIKSFRNEDWTTISVSDTGVGLTKEEMDKLFSRFGKIERYGEGLEYIDIQGSGLGLFISKEIIELHNGQIRAESLGRNKGSSFIIELPI